MSITASHLAPDTGDALTVRVIFFGKLTDLFGTAREIPIPATGCSLSTIRTALARLVDGGFESLSGSGVRVAVGRELVLDDSAWVRSDQEVAFLPAFSGG